MTNLKRLPVLLSRFVAELVGAAVVLAVAWGSLDIVGHADAVVLLVAAIVIAGARLRSGLISAAQEIGTAHVAAERVRNAAQAPAAAPAMPDPTELLHGLLGDMGLSLQSEAAQKAVDDAAEAKTAHHMAMYGATVPLEVFDHPSRGVAHVPPDFLTDEERTTLRISKDRVKELEGRARELFRSARAGGRPMPDRIRSDAAGGGRDGSKVETAGVVVGHAEEADLASMREELSGEEPLT